MHKLKIIGPKDLVSALAILGIETYPVENEGEAKLALEKASGQKDSALIFITERLAVDLEAEIDKLNKNPNINVVLIPDNRGSTGLAASRIHGLIKNSIGAEVISRR